MNKDDISKLLNIPVDDEVKVRSIEFKDGVKYIELYKDPKAYYCPTCFVRMRSKGINTREVNHPIYQDRTLCKLLVRQRTYVCPECGCRTTEHYPFLEKYKHSTTILPILVLNAMKDLNRSTASVARQYNISDTLAHDIFTMYIDLPRLPLTEYISVDEVYLNIKPDGLYAFVIMDFATGQIIDIVHNRHSDTLEEYFFSIPYEERKKVKGVISDAYEHYQSLCQNYFPNGVMVLDSFHAVKCLNDRLNNFVNYLLRRARNRQKDKLQKENDVSNQQKKSKKDSREIILLRDYRWVLLKSKDKINYSYYAYYHPKLSMSVTTDQIEKMFFEIDPRLEKMRDLKEKYLTFNSAFYSSENEIREKLNRLITEYERCDIPEFNEFAIYLVKFYDNIVRSFTAVEVRRKKDLDTYYARLSNGPMEGFNRKPKDYKRNSRGTPNFDYTRNRILWATRDDPSILAVPKTKKQIHSYRLNEKTLKKRQKNGYTKHKKDNK